MAAKTLTSEELCKSFNTRFIQLLNSLQQKANADVDNFQQQIAIANAGIANGTTTQEQISTLDQHMRSAGDMADIIKINGNKSRTAMNADETYLIRKVGQQVYKYREKIVSRDEGFLNEVNYKDLINNKSSQLDNHEHQKMFNYIRIMYSTADVTERDVIYKSVCQLLALYVNYRLKKISA